MIGYPFDSHVTYESDGTPVYDRAVSSAPLRKLIKSLFSDGILPNPSTNMQVVAGTGMNVVVYPGFACCNGCLKLEESQRTLAVHASNANYDRIDTVVLRMNDNDSERICDFYILEGTPATSPVRPTLTQTESVWEIGLADLFIVKNSSALSNQRITDTRYETARCGVMSSISEFDTTTLYQQVQADLEEFQNVSQAEFTEWYESIKGQLSEDAAGNLQNQIGLLASLETSVKTNIVNAINWLKGKLDNLLIDIEVVKDDIDTLNSNLNNVQTYNFTSNYLRSGSFNIYKLGRICLVNIPSAIDSLPVKQNVIIAELPEELFPAEITQMAFNVPGTTKTVMLTINNKDNTVVLYSYGDTVETLSTRMVLMYFSAK